MPTNYKGGNSQLLLQRQLVARTAPTPAAFKMKFLDLEISDSEPYAENNTIDNSSPLGAKLGDSDEAWTAKLNAPLDLNDIGQWLALLLGAPVTTGAGPYTHTFTLGLSDRPFALLDLGYTDAPKYRRWLDTVINSISWNIAERDQNMSLDLAPAVEVVPRPSAVFHASPTSFAANRACKKAGNIYDVSGSNTLGRVTAANISISNNHESVHIADGLAGYGAHILGLPSISGSLTALFGSDSAVMDYMEGHTSKPLVLVSKNAAGDNSLTVNIANVEFDKPKHKVPTSKGLLIDTNWRAHSGGAAPTIVLVNGIASYAS
ncbi:MAG: hypothetical protein HY272_01990 [Gammaproteobacteria bacterium]|nr:hypothetical protein [Gammaproteobacteria bacterium]